MTAVASSFSITIVISREPAGWATAAARDGVAADWPQPAAARARRIARPRRAPESDTVRSLPTEGAEVTVVYLAAREHGVVERVEDDGRGLLVLTDSGSLLRFQLMASAHFITPDRSARLAF
jgi:hypothetical protein